MKSQDFFRELETGKLLPLYYFYGAERGLIEEALDKIKGKILNPATRDFNFDVFDAKEDRAETILESLQVFPAGSWRRLVVIHQADFIWNKDPSPYIPYLFDPNPLTCAVFIGEKADLRSKFFQALGKMGVAIPFYHLPEKELIFWVHEQVEQLGLQISNEALSLLLERVGSNSSDLKIELQKLSLRPGGKKRIEEEDVLSLTGEVKNESPFELPLAVGRLDKRETFRLLRKNLQQGASPLLLFSLILRQLRLIRRAQELRANGGEKKEIERRLRILPRSAGEFWEQVERFPPAHLEKLWPLNLEVDQELKSSRADKGLLLEKYLWNLHLRSQKKMPKSPGA